MSMCVFQSYPSWVRLMWGPVVLPAKWWVKTTRLNILVNFHKTLSSWNKTYIEFFKYFFGLLVEYFFQTLQRFLQGFFLRVIFTFYSKILLQRFDIGFNEWGQLIFNWKRIELNRILPCLYCQDWAEKSWNRYVKDNMS